MTQIESRLTIAFAGWCLTDSHASLILVALPGKRGANTYKRAAQLQRTSGSCYAGTHCSQQGPHLFRRTVHFHLVSVFCQLIVAVSGSLCSFPTNWVRNASEVIDSDVTFNARHSRPIKIQKETTRVGSTPLTREVPNGPFLMFYLVNPAGE